MLHKGWSPSQVANKIQNMFSLCTSHDEFNCVLIKKTIKKEKKNNFDLQKEILLYLFIKIKFTALNAPLNLEFIEWSFISLSFFKLEILLFEVMARFNVQLLLGSHSRFLYSVQDSTISLLY